MGLLLKMGMVSWLLKVFLEVTSVGLGLPCLVNVLMKGKPMEVNIDDFAIVLAILISMISLITALIALSGWKLTKWVGLASFTCFAMYISFFVYDNLPFTSCL